MKNTLIAAFIFLTLSAFSQDTIRLSNSDIENFKFAIKEIEDISLRLREIEEINLRIDSYSKQNKMSNNLFVIGILTSLVGSATLITATNGKVANAEFNRNIAFGFIGAGSVIMTVGWFVHLDSHNRLKRPIK